MTPLEALTDIVDRYPPGPPDDPLYAFAGGVAVHHWLRDASCRQSHHDIDIFSFKSSFMASFSTSHSGNETIIATRFFNDGTASIPQCPPLTIEVIRGSYFDAEITPNTPDTVEVRPGRRPFFVLSPEFLVVSKISYPNVHRGNDFRDIVDLCRSGRLDDSSRLEDLLRRTSLGSMIDARDLFRLKDHHDLQAIIDSIHHELIRRFLYWDRIHIEALNPFQMFVLLDIGDEVYCSGPELDRFVDSMLGGVALGGRDRQIGALGLQFLTIGMPERGYQVLEREGFRDVVRRGLASIPEDSNAWLSRSKLILKAMRELARLEQWTGHGLDWIWQPIALTTLVERILLRDASRFALLAAIRAVGHDIERGELPRSGVGDTLHRILVTPSGPSAGSARYAGRMAEPVSRRPGLT
jgi:hypothetical protein